MNFYKSQDEARRRTKILAGYYVLAIIGVVLSVYALIAFARLKMLSSSYPEYDQFGNAVSRGSTASFWDFQLFCIVAVITTLVILSGWMFKKFQVDGGGGVVAQSLGGRPVSPDTRDPEEKQLMNVVEEMAIASGVPVPQVWILDQESGINAFAAGTEPGNAAIGVTRGTVQLLNRPELQGVIAHEFSHILNGDMKMNIRMMCMLHGLLLISIIGRLVFNIALYSGSSRDKEGNSKLPLLAIGIGLMVIGGIGAFFASLIQAAISRQREYLADASAVEFTMDPNGIAGALKKIGGASGQSSVKAPSASEMQHMFFAGAGMFNYGFASHPPLEERIELIEPAWDGDFVVPSVRNVRQQSELRTQQQAANEQQRQSDFQQMGQSVITAAVMMDDIGESNHTKIQKGQAIVAELMPEWKQAAHDKQHAQLLIYGLLLAVDGELRDGEIQHLTEELGAEMASIAVAWQGQLLEVHSSNKIALVDLCVPTLRQLSRGEYDEFIKHTKWLISSDNNVDLFEFMLQKILQRHLDSHFIGDSTKKVKYRALANLSAQANVVISTMAGVGANSQQELDQAYHVAESLLKENGCSNLGLLGADQCGLDAIDDALMQIELATSMVKKQFLVACGKAVMSDGVVTSREAELLRATADAIGCSIPPFVELN